MELTTEQIRGLTELLLECSCVQSVDGCRNIKNNLPKHIKITVKTAETSLAYLSNIVDRCAAFPNGIEALVRVIDYFDKGSSAIQNVWKCIPDTIGFEDPVPHEAITGLLKSFPQKLSSKLLTGSYKKVVPEAVRFDINSPPIKSLGRWEMLRELSNMIPQPRHDHPLFMFLELAGEKSRNKKLRSAFNKWIEQVKPITERNELKKLQNKKETEHEVYLLIKMSPNSLSMKRPGFTAQVYKWSGKNQVLSLKVIEGDQQKIAEKLDLLLEEIDGDILPKRIEVFLSCEWIFDITPHKWIRKKGMPFSTELGCIFETVNRLDRKKLHRANCKVSNVLRKSWKDKWGCFRQTCCPSELDTAMYQLEEKELKCLEILRRKLNATGAGTMLLADFEPIQAKEELGLGHILLQAGIPVAIWGDFKKDKISGLLKKQDIKDLPEIVFKARKDAIAEDDIGNKIQLLWDNPTREPPEPDFDDDALYGT